MKTTLITLALLLSHETHAADKFEVCSKAVTKACGTERLPADPEKLTIKQRELASCRLIALVTCLEGNRL